MRKEGDYTHPAPQLIARGLDSRLARIVMIGVVLGSVIPEIHVFDVPWLLYLTFFLGIAALRGIILPFKTHRTTTDWLFLLGDFFIAITFLPWDAWLPMVTTQQLHTLWVARLLILLRPSRHFLKDLWGVLTRRERVQQFFSVTMAVAILSLLSATILRNLAGPFDYDGRGTTGDEAFIDALWWAFRQLESPDNLIPHLEHEPIIVVISLLLTVTGVFFIAFIIGLGAGVVEQMVQAERRRPVDYSDHSIIIGPIHDAEILIREFVRLHEKNRGLRRIRFKDLWMWLRGRGPRPRRHALPHITLLGPKLAPPPFLYEPMMRRVLYRGAEDVGPQGLTLVAARRAKRAILLSPTPRSASGDASTLAALSAFRQQNPRAKVFAEILDSENRHLAEVIGGPSTLALEMPRIMGQFLAQHLVIPGIDSIFQDLLTARGSEFYTHIFITPWEREALARMAEAGPNLPWAQLRELGEEREVSLVGVLLRKGDAPAPTGPKGLDISGLHLWLNPLDTPFDPALQGQVSAGMIPLDRLAGLVGISETYAELKALGIHLLNHPEDLHTPITPDAALLPLVQGLNHDDGHLERVLVVGDGPALPPLVRELFTLRPGLEVVLLMPEGRGGSPSIAQRMESLGGDWGAHEVDEELKGLRCPRLGGQGQLRVRLARQGTMAQTAASLSAQLTMPEAAVFLGYDQGRLDPDDATTHRVLRFVEALYTQPSPPTKALHLLVELNAEDAGERLDDVLQALTPDSAPITLTTVSSDRIKNYFLVHSAFVPAVDLIYEILLSEKGQDLMRLTPGDLPASLQGTAPPFEAIVAALAPRRVIPIAYALKGQAATLHPPRGEAIDLSRLEAIFVVGDTRRDQHHRQRLALGSAP